MNAATWERVQTVFHQAVALAEPEQSRFLETACAGDLEMLAEVRKMLEADRRGDSLVERGLPEVAARWVGQPGSRLPVSEVGPYRLKAFLGAGGMGVVYLAEHRTTGKEAAIKFLVGAGMSPARVERFTHEVNVQAKLAHAGIAAQYDADTLEDGTPWFAMEYVKGQHFLEYCQEHAHTLEERLELFLAVCRALRYLHGKAIIHRDLKPSNILVDESGNPRVLDFGIAKELAGADEAATTRAELRMMTPEYAAPEWVRDGQVDLSTDVYSLGVLFYEMLAGERPSGEVRLPAKAEAGKSARRELEKICRKALQADPQERYRTVDELMRDIEHFRNNEPLEAQPPSARYRLEKFLARNRTRVAAVALTLLLFGGMAVFFTVRLAKERNLALAEAARTRRIQNFLVGMLDGGVKSAAPSQDLRVLTLLDRAARQADELRQDPATQAELYKTLGEMYQALGSMDKSGELQRLALEKTKAAWGPDDPRVADNLMQLGALSALLGQFKDAERLTEEGLSLASRRLPPGDIEILKGKCMLGEMLAAAREYEKARAILKPLTLAPPNGEDETELFLRALSALGMVDLYTGQYPEAERYYRQALDGVRKFYGDSHPQTAHVLADLGALELTLGRYQDAEKVYREAIRTGETWYGAEQPEVVQMKGILASALIPQGQLTEADTLLRQVLRADEKLYPGPHPYIAFTLHSLGRVAVKRGDWAEAETYFGRAFSMQRKLYGNTDFSVAVIACDFADVPIHKKQYEKAEALLREAVATMAAQPHPGNPTFGVAQAKYGRVLVALGRYREAEGPLTAGYALLQASRGVSAQRIQEARSDLAAMYRGLHEPEKAARYVIR